MKVVDGTYIVVEAYDRIHVMLSSDKDGVEDYDELYMLLRSFIVVEIKTGRVIKSRWTNT